MVLHCPVESAQIRSRERFGELGISADRVDFVGYQPWERYIQTYHRIDVALDPFPYGGGITICDTLWMGVPVVTLSGAAAANRTGRSIVTNIGLPQLAARDCQEYVRIASDAASLIPLRTGLRQRMISSPLMDATRFGRDLAGVYRQMWRRYCGV
jgi:predicted O-linked N-acetylglucosamine transferase (SPINDLY family)